MVPLEHKDVFSLCLDQMKQVAFVQSVAIKDGNLAGDGVDTRPGHNADPTLELETLNGTYDLVVVLSRSHLTRTMVDGILARIARHPPGAGWILFAPHVGRSLGGYLAEQGANYIDPSGNCHLQLGVGLFAHVEGRPAESTPRRGRAMGAPGYRVIFALLVQPDLLLAPVRTLAAAAEVAPATAANALALLRQEGLVHETGVGRRLTAPQQLLERWLRGYETVVRPKLLLGQFQTPDPDPEAVERRIASSLSSEDEPWAYGGTAGANRLTGYYRGEETVIHLGAYSKETLRRLRAVRSKDGSLVMLQVPSNLAFTSPADRAVAPLLIYSELLHNGDRRSLETAAEVMERYLGDLSA